LDTAKSVTVKSDMHSSLQLCSLGLPALLIKT
jgi:hypothetical protein